MDDVMFVWASALFLFVPVIFKYMLAFKGRSLYVELRRQEREVDTLISKLESLERWRWITIRAATFVAWLLTHVVPKYVN